MELELQYLIESFDYLLVLLRDSKSLAPANGLARRGKVRGIFLQGAWRLI
jgi:hypothetical protein